MPPGGYSQAPLVSQAVAAQSASSVLQVAEQQLPLPLSPQTPDWHRSLALQAVPSGSPFFPVLDPPLTDPEVVAVPPVVVPDPPVVPGPPVVPVVPPLDEPQAVPKKRANPAAAVIACRMCKTSFVNASRGLPKTPIERVVPRACPNLLKNFMAPKGRGPGRPSRTAGDRALQARDFCKRVAR